MEILQFPNSILFSKCDEVSVFGPELRVILENMWDAMKFSNGLGLAANQVGLLYSMFVMEGPDKERLFIINPKILRKSEVPANLEEGCLSAPGEILTIKDRASWVEVEFKDETGKTTKRVFKGIWSVCVQHEIEHLNGNTFLQSKSLLKVKRKALAKKWKIKQNK
jgi:peptide deformylase